MLQVGSSTKNPEQQDTRQNHADEFSFWMLEDRFLKTLVRRRLIAQQLRAVLPISFVSPQVVGEQMRQVRPESDAFEALAQFLCLDVALGNRNQDRPTTRESVARTAQKCSGFDFMPFTQSAIYRYPDGSTAIDTANLRCDISVSTDDRIRQVAMAEAFSETRAFTSYHKTGPPDDYSMIREYRNMPEPDITYFQKFLVG